MSVTHGARPPKAAVLLAQSIVQDTFRERLKPGDMLSPERTMLERYKTGRGTLREALRLLEFQGVISLKPGPRGGPVLQDPDASHLASTVILLMQLKQAPFRSIVEVRSALEPMTSSLAAVRMTDEDLSAVEDSVFQMRDELDNQRAFLAASTRFHDLIAWSSGNALFGYIVDSLLGIMDGSAIGIDYPPHRRTAILEAHIEIFEALKSRDPDVAEERMRRHIEEYERYAERKFPHLLDEVIPWEQKFLV
jgi:GntR family transcriptional regulator, transcriptional repressor for pyruvate dehydrogenase complex